MVTKKWKRMALFYERFADADLDFSDQRLEDCFEQESFGKEIPDPGNNGWYQGKRNMDITVKMWIQDIKKGLLFRNELYEEFPKWFIDKVLGDTLLEDKASRIEHINIYRRMNER